MPVYSKIMGFIYVLNLCTCMQMHLFFYFLIAHKLFIYTDLFTMEDYYHYDFSPHFNLPFSHPGICSTWDQSHYHTFDGKSYTYQGVCNYALAIDCRPGSDDFAIHVENDPNCDPKNSASCKRAVVMYVNDIAYKVAHNNIVSVDGDQGIHLPYKQNGVSISKHVDYTFIEAWQGKVFVKFDGAESIYVQLAPEYKNATCGLCGNYNDASGDDLQFKTPHEFGNSMGKPNPGKTCIPVTHEPVDKCTNVSSLVSIVSNLKCKLLTDLPAFKECNKVVAAAPFYEKCKQDMCANNAVSNHVCHTFTQYSRKCIHHGVHMDWRTAELCRKFFNKTLSPSLLQ